MGIHTHRTVSILHEPNDALPMVSMRFPSKSLQEQNVQRSQVKQKSTKTQTIIYVLLYTRTHSQFNLGISRQMSSSFVKELFSRTLSISDTQCATDTNQQQHLITGLLTSWQITSKEKKERVRNDETHSKTKEFRPEKVMVDIWLILLFSRILYANETVKYMFRYWLKKKAQIDASNGL